MVVLSACTKKTEKNNQITSWKQYQARLYDIPIAINAMPLHNYCSCSDSSSAMQLGYSSLLSKDKLIEFYRHEMERAGWLEYAIIDGFQSVLLFEKPRRVCSVAIERNSKKQTFVLISIGLKK